MWEKAARTVARSRRSMLHRVLLIVLSTGCLAAAGCKKAPAPTEQAPEQAASQPLTSPPPSPSTSLLPNEKGATSGSGQGTLTLPTSFGKRTGDLDEMAKARTIRALVILTPISFFYESGKPHGIQYEALEEFQKSANQKLNTGKLPVQVVFLPMRPDQLESALTQGLGDMIAHGIVITPEREQRVAFSIPINTDVSQVVVTGSALANVSSFDDLAGKTIYVNPLTTYYDNLRKLSDTQQKAGKQPLTIKAADKNLSDDDLIEMANAGLIPATATTKERADLWAQVLPNIRSHPDLVVASGEKLAWVMRKNNPQLKQSVDEFAQGHVVGTSFGNTLLRRYMQKTKWIRNSTSPEELKKFNAYVQFSRSTVTNTTSTT